MICTKKIIGNLNKCYSLLKLDYNGTEHLVVASEKEDKCFMFDLDGNYEETLWEKPGGVMDMEQVPGTNGQFLAINKFYSPDNSESAKIVTVTPKGKNNWEIKTLVNLPFVHRIGILKCGDVNYFIAATIKSAHAFDNDWTCPGRVWVAELPKNLSVYDEDNQLEMKALLSGLFHNHGFRKIKDNEEEYVLIGADNGVIKLAPPKSKGGEWTIQTLVSDPASDMIPVDFDNDGVNEILTFSPFHGDTLSIYKKINGEYTKVYTHSKPLEFLHAIWGGNLLGEPTVIAGYRGGDKELLMIKCTDKSRLKFDIEVLDHDIGPANILHFVNNGVDCFLSSNREIDEIAVYEISNEGKTV